jgi:hypothetical protein
VSKFLRGLELNYYKKIRRDYYEQLTWNGCRGLQIEGLLVERNYLRKVEMWGDGTTSLWALENKCCKGPLPRQGWL